MIETLYSLIDTVLPFAWVDHQFMKNALIAIILISPVFGIIGTMVVNNQMAFFSDAIGHSTFTGLAIGTILGISNLSLSAIGFAIFFAISITFLRHKSKTSSDTIISTFTSIAVAFGIAILSSGGGFKKYSTYLIGDLLSISTGDLLALFLVFVFILLVWYFLFNHLFLSSLSPCLARARGTNILLIELLFTITIAIVVTISIQWVGILLINSLIVLPAGAAKNISKNMRAYHIYSICIALFSGLSGLIISYYINISTGAMIVLVAGILFILTTVIKTRFD